VILLLDANALVWWLADDPTLAGAARSAIHDDGNDVLVSAATVWELAIKRAKGRIRLTVDLADAIDQAGFKGLPVTLADAEAAAALPPHHGDPFDRMLVAHALELAATVVSRDALLDAYGINRLPA
jgi:PIN domain nuclease of toxin-antitoxin system